MAIAVKQILKVKRSQNATLIDIKNNTSRATPIMRGIILFTLAA
jgi:hypothetical protein